MGGDLRRCVGAMAAAAALIWVSGVQAAGWQPAMDVGHSSFVWDFATSPGGHVAAIAADGALLLRAPGARRVNLEPGHRVPNVNQIAVGDDGTVAVAGHHNLEASGQVMIRRPDGVSFSRYLGFIPSSESAEHGVTVASDGTVTVLEQFTTTTPNRDPGGESSWVCTITTRAWTIPPDATETSALPVTQIGEPTAPRPQCDYLAPPRMAQNRAGDIVAVTTGSSPQAGAHGAIHTLRPGGVWSTRQADALGGDPAVAIDALGRWIVARRLPYSPTTGIAIAATWGSTAAGTTTTALLSEADAAHRSTRQVVGIDDAGTATVLWQTYAPAGGGQYARTLWSRAIDATTGTLADPAVLHGPEAAHPPNGEFNGPDDANYPWVDPQLAVAGPGPALAIWRQLSAAGPDSARRMSFASRTSSATAWSAMPSPFAAFTLESGRSVWRPRVAMEPGGDGVALWQTAELGERTLAAIWDTSPPVLRYVGLPSTIRAGTAVEMRVRAVDLYGPVTARWDFGDGTPKQPGDTVTHTYTSAGDRTVTVRIQDRVGNAIEQTRSLSVNPATTPPSGASPPDVWPVGIDTLRLSGVAVTPSRVLAGTRVAVRLTLTKAAVVRVTIWRGMRGRRVDGRCVATRRTNAPRCLRWVPLGSFTRSLTAGPSALTLPRSMGDHPLSPGTFRVRVTANAGTERATSPAVRFTVRPRARRE